MDGSRKVLILPVSLFQDVPDDKIPTRVTDTYTCLLYTSDAADD